MTSIVWKATVIVSMAGCGVFRKNLGLENYLVQLHIIAMKHRAGIILICTALVTAQPGLDKTRYSRSGLARRVLTRSQ